VKAVTGREVLGAAEIRDMHIADVIASIWEQYEAAPDTEQWVASNPKKWEIIAGAQMEHEQWLTMQRSR